MKRERLRQIFKERFEDFDADNDCVTKFVISKNKEGLWYVKLSCSIDIIRYVIIGGVLNSITIQYDIEDRCVWVGDFFEYRANVIAGVSGIIHITFYPLDEV